MTGCTNHQKNEFSSCIKNQVNEKSYHIIDSYEYNYKDKILDLSNNHQLENISIGYGSSIQQIKVPPSLINFVISDYVAIEKSLDLSSCDNLTTLVVGSHVKLKDVIKMPNSIKCLYINDHAQICGKLDLSCCQRLKFLVIGEGAQLNELILPSSLLNIYINSGVHIKDTLDLSRCEQLSKFSPEPGANFGNILLPKQLQKATFGESSVVQKKLDLSECTHLRDLSIGDFTKFVEGCKLPTSLKELIICSDVRVAGGLDVSKCKQLEKLLIYDPETILDLSNCRKLKELCISNCIPTGMESLTELEKLCINMGSRLNTKLDLSRCSNLNSFVIEDDVLLSKGVNLSGCEKLFTLKIGAYFRQFTDEVQHCYTLQ
ncbi:MAG: hypothetical protein LBT67_02630 [Holosporaceae bacterium]|nr:hypothetical protein [Holosporaceae bacterium]